jgi:CBS domain-containing protein
LRKAALVKVSSDAVSDEKERMKDLKAGDLMSTNVVAVSPKATVIEAAKLMLEYRVSSLPVVDDGGLVVGVISEGDLVQRVEIGTDALPKAPFSLELARQFLKAHSQRVEDVMTPNVVAVAETTPLAEIANLFQSRRLKRVPVQGGEVLLVLSVARMFYGF